MNTQEEILKNFYGMPQNKVLGFSFKDNPEFLSFLRAENQDGIIYAKLDSEANFVHAVWTARGLNTLSRVESETLEFIKNYHGQITIFFDLDSLKEEQKEKNIANSLFRNLFDNYNFGHFTFS